MIKRIRQNKSLRASKRQKFRGDNRETIYSGVDRYDKAIFKKFPKKHVDQIVHLIKQKFRAKRRKELVFLIILFSLVGTLFIYSVASTTDYSKKSDVGNTSITVNSSPPTIWSGKRSDPLKVPFSNFFYSPFVGSMEFEVQIDKSYTLYDDDMVVNNTTNILFFDSECNLIKKLLPKNGYISWMYVGPRKKGIGPKKIIYSLAEKDTDNDGFVNDKDRRYIYISNLNGKELARVTKRRVQSIEWVGQGEEIVLTFGVTESKKDSLYGYFHTKTRNMKLTNQTKDQTKNQ